MKKFLMMAALMVATLTVSAQEYNWAAGLRSHGYKGAVLTAKKYLDKNAIEFGVATNLASYVHVEADYLWQQPVIGEGFTLYYGAGAKVGLGDNSLTLGAEAVVGLEYQIPNVPLAVSVDYRPGLGLLPELPDPDFVNFGVGLKYCF